MENEDNGLITLGKIFLKKEKHKEKCDYTPNDTFFNYHGIKNALISGQIDERGRILFTPTRIRVLQMIPTEQTISNIIQTNLKFEKVEMVFDSDKKKWSQSVCEFYKDIHNKNKLLFVIRNEEDEIFGYYIDEDDTIDAYTYNETKTKGNSYHFNLNSNGRLNGPITFKLQRDKHDYYKIYEQQNNELITIGDIVLMKQHMKHLSYVQNTNIFNYNTISAKASSSDLTNPRNSDSQKDSTSQMLCGKFKFTIKKLLVYQVI